MSIKNFRQFHDLEQVKLLKRLAGVWDDIDVSVTGSQESETGKVYAAEACEEANARVAADDVEDASDLG